MEQPKTLQEAVLYFADFENCKAIMTELRWPDGKVKCPTCGSEKVTWLANARLWKCYGGHSRPKFSLKTGTVFEDSPLGLDKWLAALWLLINCKNGISSYEVGRDLGISQKSTWHMLHRLRFALYKGSINKLSGQVEADETFIGGRARNMHASKRAKTITARGPKDKTIVMGILERGGEVRAKVVETNRRPVVQGYIREHVLAGSAIFTDSLPSYPGLDEFQHEVVDHAVAYVNGEVHTNGMENFWSLLKRSLKGTYISVEPFHLFRYVDEQVFRYNNRRMMDDYGRFRLALSQIVGKRLTWDQLTGKKPDDATCLN
jgi:transposase-like protein